MPRASRGRGISDIDHSGSGRLHSDPAQCLRNGGVVPKWATNCSKCTVSISRHNNKARRDGDQREEIVLVSVKSITSYNICHMKYSGVGADWV